MKIPHFWNYFGTPDANTQRRMDVAQATWNQFSNHRLAGPWGRDSSSILPGPAAPFVRDLFDCFSHMVMPAEIICFSNADVGFVPNAAHRIIEAVSQAGACYTSRRDFQNTPIESIYTIKDGAKYPGPDAFCFTQGWIERYLRDIPDFIFARQHWDCWMRNAMRRYGAMELDALIWHETHAPQWLSGECNRQNTWNERLLCEWIAKNGGSEQDHLYTNEELGFR